MCTNFTDLNKCCLKDDFSLIRIDQIIDLAAGCDIVALLDCFSRYHQIWFRKENEEKTSFITPFGTYCYMRMPEGLRNASPMFYRLMKAAEGPSRKECTVLVNDIVVASKKRESYISDLSETFANMREENLKLNPEKSIFWGNKRQGIELLGLHQRYRGQPR
jgi:hypothetical protein